MQLHTNFAFRRPGSLNLCDSWGWPEQWRTQELFSGGCSTNSVEDRGQRGRGSGGGSPLVRGFWRQL